MSQTGACVNIKDTLPAVQPSCLASFKGLISVHIYIACLCGGIVMDKVTPKLLYRSGSRTEYELWHKWRQSLYRPVSENCLFSLCLLDVQLHGIIQHG